MGRSALSPYQRRLFVVLSLSCFFEGFDFFALTQVLPQIRETFHLSRAEGGTMVSVINVGTMAAYGVVRLGDRFGRRPLLLVSVGGYMLLSCLSALAPDAVSFTALQLLARVVLIAAWATSMVYAAEEFPADRRGMVIGVIQATSSLGGVVCAGVVPLLLGTRFGFRAVYASAALPFLFLPWAAKTLKETSRFSARGVVRRASPLAELLSPPYRRWSLRLGLLWLLAYIGTSSAVTFWKDFAVHERSLSDGQVATSVTFAALLSLPLVFASGKWLDFAGRRVGGAVTLVVAFVGVVAAYSVYGHALLTASLVFAIFGAGATLALLNALTTELFPTHLRADALALTNNLLGRTGYVVAPILIGHAATAYGYGRAMVSVACALPFAVAILLATMPETRGRELEETAR